MFAVDGSLKRLLSNNYLFCLGTLCVATSSHLHLNLVMLLLLNLPLPPPELLGILRVLPAYLAVLLLIGQSLPICIHLVATRVVYMNIFRHRE